MVVANAVAALAEIAEVSGRDVLQVTRESIKKLLRALNECTEWGQVGTCSACQRQSLIGRPWCNPRLDSLRMWVSSLWTRSLRQATTKYAGLPHYDAMCPA